MTKYSRARAVAKNMGSERAWFSGESDTDVAVFAADASMPGETSPEATA